MVGCSGRTPTVRDTHRLEPWGTKQQLPFLALHSLALGSEEIIHAL